MIFFKQKTWTRLPPATRLWTSRFWARNLRASSHLAVGIYKMLVSTAVLQSLSGVLNLCLILPSANTQVYLRDVSINRAWLEVCTSSLYFILTHAVFILLLCHFVVQLWPIRENDTHPNPCPWYHTAAISTIVVTLTAPIMSLLLTAIHNPARGAFLKTTEQVNYILTFGDSYKLVEFTWSVQNIMYLHFMLVVVSLLCVWILISLLQNYTQNLLHWYPLYLPEGASVQNKTWYQKIYYWLRNTYAITWFVILASILITALIYLTLYSYADWQLSNPYWGYLHGSEPTTPECAEVIWRAPWFYGPIITFIVIFQKSTIQLVSTLLGFIIVFKTPWARLKRKDAVATFKRTGYRMKSTWTSRLISINMLGLFLLLCSPTTAPWFTYFVDLPYLTVYLLASLFVFTFHRKFSLNKFVYYIRPFFRRSC